MNTQLVEVIDILLTILINKKEPFEIIPINDKIIPSNSCDIENIYRPYLQIILHCLYHNNVLLAYEYFTVITNNLDGYLSSLDGYTSAKLIDSILNSDIEEFNKTRTNNKWTATENKMLDKIFERIIKIK